MEKAAVNPVTRRLTWPSFPVYLVGRCALIAQIGPGQRPLSGNRIVVSLFEDRGSYGQEAASGNVNMLGLFAS